MSTISNVSIQTTLPDHTGIEKEQAADKSDVPDNTQNPVKLSQTFKTIDKYLKNCDALINQVSRNYFQQILSLKEKTKEKKIGVDIVHLKELLDHQVDRTSIRGVLSRTYIKIDSLKQQFQSVSHRISKSSLEKLVGNYNNENEEIKNYFEKVINENRSITFVYVDASKFQILLNNQNKNNALRDILYTQEIEMRKIEDEESTDEDKEPISESKTPSASSIDMLSCQEKIRTGSQYIKALFNNKSDRLPASCQERLQKLGFHQQEVYIYCEDFLSLISHQKDKTIIKKNGKRIEKQREKCLAILSRTNQLNGSAPTCRMMVENLKSLIANDHENNDDYDKTSAYFKEIIEIHKNNAKADVDHAELRKLINYQKNRSGPLRTLISTTNKKLKEIESKLSKEQPTQTTPPPELTPSQLLELRNNLELRDNKMGASIQKNLDFFANMFPLTNKRKSDQLIVNLTDEPIDKNPKI
ncbi:MAG TPA: hypothetical protein VLG49_04270 [Rhabdochlamydiaceae bacterium]|nr:hypothetical protein [Rhabdochlamydiaceae bacterium]